MKEFLGVIATGAAIGGAIFIVIVSIAAAVEVSFRILTI